MSVVFKIYFILVMLGAFAISVLLLPRAKMSCKIFMLLKHMSMVHLLDKKSREE